MEITGKNRAIPIVRISKTMRSIQLKSLLLGVLIWFGCDQNLRPLPEDTGQASRSALLEQQTAFAQGSGGRVSGRSLEEEQPAIVLASGASISGTIDITPSLFSRLRGSETLYIMARRDEGGPPMAVKRIQAPAVSHDLHADGSGPDGPGPALFGRGFHRRSYRPGWKRRSPPGR